MGEKSLLLLTFKILLLMNVRSIFKIVVVFFKVHTKLNNFEIKSEDFNMIVLCILHKQQGIRYNNVLTIFISNNRECIPATESSTLLI